MQGLLRFILGNHRIARPLGIGVYVHGTLIAFAALLVLADMAAGGALAGLGTALLMAVLFGSVALHELGHAAAALGFGVPTRSITLLPMGGVALLERELRSPRAELVVALAGPATNVVLAGLLALLARVLGAVGLGGLPLALLDGALWLNVALAVFNLLPAFPMDGGRVLRAALSTRIGRLRATRVAARLGLVLAAAMGVVGLFGGGFTLVLIAGFVFLAARAELNRVEQEHAPPPFSVPLGFYGIRIERRFREI